MAWNSGIPKADLAGLWLNTQRRGFLPPSSPVPIHLSLSSSSSPSSLQAGRVLPINQSPSQEASAYRTAYHRQAIAGSAGPSAAGPSANIFDGPLESLADLEKKIRFLAVEKNFISSRLIEAICAKLNEMLQAKFCLRAEDFQERIAFLRNFITLVKELSGAHRLEAVLRQHIVYTEQTAKILYRTSFIPVQDSIWPLYERILNLPTLKPDYFGAAVATLHEKLLYADAKNPLAQQLQKAVLGLRAPAHQLRENFSSPKAQLEELEEIVFRWKTLLHEARRCEEQSIQAMVDSLQVVIETYQNFIEDLKGVKTEEERGVLLEPKAQLTGAGCGFFCVSQQVARTLLCLDARGRAAKKLVGGRALAHLEGVFYKPNPEGMHHIRPEMELAVYSLYSTIKKGTAAPTTLVKISGVFFEGRHRPYGRVLQAGLGVDGVSMQELFGVSEVVQFLQNSLGQNKGEETFVRILDLDWILPILDVYPDLAPHQLADLPPMQAAERLVEAFQWILNPLPLHKRLKEFSKVEALANVGPALCDHIKKHSSSGLVAALGLLYQCLDLATVSARQGLRQVSVKELVDFAGSLRKVREIFPYQPAAELWKSLPLLIGFCDTADISAHLFVSLLTGPSDHKGDNVFATLQRDDRGGIKTIKITAIDNDQAFEKAFISDRGRVKAGIRTVIYLLPGMNAKFSESIRRRILVKTPEEWVADWLASLEEENRRYARLQSQQVLVETDFVEEETLSLKIPLKISFELVLDVYEKAKTIHQALQGFPQLTNRQLFGIVEPKLSLVYEQFLAQSDSLQEAIGRIYSQPVEGIQLAAESFPCRDEPEELPADIVARWIQQLPFHTYTLQLQVALFGKALQAFPTLTTQLALPGQPSNPLSRRSFFFTAVGRGYLKLVERLVKDEQEVHLADAKSSLLCFKEREGKTALLLACAAVDLPMVQCLARAGADLRAYDAERHTSLLLCMQQFTRAPVETSALARWIVDQPDCLVNSTDRRGCTPLHQLVALAEHAPEQAEPLIAYLIEKGANLDRLNSEGKTALDVAIEACNERVAQQLIFAGAGCSVNICSIRSFLLERPALQPALRYLQERNLKLRWHLAMEALALQQPASACTLAGASMKAIALAEPLVAQLFDDEGNIRPKRKNGTARICFSGELGDYALEIRQWAEKPWVEGATNKLLELLVGHSTPHAELMKITNCQGRSYPVLVSLVVEGGNLGDPHPEQEQQFEKIETLAFWQTFLASLLTNHGGAKPEDWLLEPLSNGCYRLVGINNAYAFTSGTRLDVNDVPVQCFIHSLAQMAQPICAEAAAYFRSLNPEELLPKWLDHLVEQQQLQCDLFSSDQRAGFLVRLRKGVVAEIYQKFRRLQAVLATPGLTGEEILGFVNLFPDTGYGLLDPAKTASSNYPSGLGRQSASVTEVTQLLPEAIHELNAIRELIQQENASLSVLRAELQNGETKGFCKPASFEFYEKIVNGSGEDSPGIDFGLILPRLRKKVLQAIASMRYRHLCLRGCPLTKDALQQILKNSPLLVSLELHNCALDASLLRILSEKGSSLKKLVIKNISLKQVKLALPSLRYLSIADSEPLREIVLTASCLQTFRVENCVQLDAVRGPASGSTLSWLAISNCPKFAPWSILMQNFGRDLFKLRQVSIAPNGRAQEKEILKAILYHPRAAELVNVAWQKYQPSFDETLGFIDCAQTPKLLDLILPFYLSGPHEKAHLNRRRQTALHVAAYWGRKDCVKSLLAQYGAKDGLGHTALHTAAKTGNIEVVCLMIEKGVDPFALTSEGENCLHFCADNEHLDLLQQLLKQAPDKTSLLKALHQPDSDGKNPLHRCMWGRPKPGIALALLEAGTDPKSVNKFDYTPLHWAAKHGHEVSVRYLLERGASRTALNFNGETALDLAVRWRQPEVARLLADLASFETVLSDLRQKHGTDMHPDILPCLTYLAAACRALEKPERAVGYYEQALAVDQRLYGETPRRSLVNILENLAELAKALGNNQQAERYLKTALLVSKQLSS